MFKFHLFNIYNNKNDHKDGQLHEYLFTLLINTDKMYELKRGKKTQVHGDMFLF